ncbi:putative glycolipid-binding domain-containing protein [Cellulomonas sp. zg-ZUI22]|nr:putative glycolipid-binding domain-containing protein [Cellulomonas sp. zg-ZUI22]
MYMSFPPFAAWRFVDAVDGFEVAYLEPGRLRGHTSAVEGGRAHAVAYDITLDGDWRTRSVRVSSDTVDGLRTTELLSDGQGSWTVDGRPAPRLDGLLDVDLEASACTNTFPVHRLTLPVGEEVAATAVYPGRARRGDARLPVPHLPRRPARGHLVRHAAGSGRDRVRVHTSPRRPRATEGTAHAAGRARRAAAVGRPVRRQARRRVRRGDRRRRRRVPDGCRCRGLAAAARLRTGAGAEPRDAAPAAGAGHQLLGLLLPPALPPRGVPGPPPHPGPVPCRGVRGGVATPGAVGAPSADFSDGPRSDLRDDDALRPVGRDLRDRCRWRLEAELAREVVEGHRLHGLPVQAVAVHRPEKEVVFWLPQEDLWAWVHLTWTKESSPRWPSVVLCDSWQALVRELREAARG